MKKYFLNNYEKFFNNNNKNFYPVSPKGVFQMLRVKNLVCSSTHYNN